MTQASLQLQQFVNHVWHWLDAIAHSKPVQRYSRQVEAAKVWLLPLVLVLVLWIWNWHLVFSGGMGLAALLLVYLMQQGQWQLPQINWRALWKPSNRALTLGLLSGTIVCLSTYFTLAIWQESGGSWLAKGMILEGLGILAIGLLLLWQRIEQFLNQPARNDHSFDRWLNDLSDADALKRLIAVRCLTQSIAQGNSSVVNQSGSLPCLSAAELADCFRLMLDRETEPIVCRALLSSLQTLDPKPTRCLQPGQSLPFHTPERSRSQDATGDVRH